MSEIWTDQAKYQLWLEIETCAMEAMVEHGLVPKQALADLKAHAKFSVERIDELEATLKHDVLAFLTNVAEHVGENARYLHWGMTSSDLLDTSFSVQLCRATDLLLGEVDKLLEIIKRRAFEHKATPCVGRSHGIHADPTCFGLKFAGWYAELKRQRRVLERARTDMAVGAFSGPVGTFAYLDPKIETSICKKLGLAPDPISTQVISRDRHAALFQAMALVAATLERMVIEVRHLQRTEVREAEEFFSQGQKGSSSMPHKRNPVLSENITGLSRMMRAWAGASLENVALWHERDISHSSVERFIAPDMTITLDFMLGRVQGIVDKLVVYPENMQRNLELTQGLIFSGTLLVELAARGISREHAYKLVQTHALATWDAINSGVVTTPFRERIESDSEIKKILTPEVIAAAFSIDRHIAHVDEIYRRVFS